MRLMPRWNWLTSIWTAKGRAAQNAVAMHPSGDLTARSCGR